MPRHPYFLKFFNPAIFCLAAGGTSLFYPENLDSIDNLARLGVVAAISSLIFAACHFLPVCVIGNKSARMQGDLMLIASALKTENVKVWTDRNIHSESLA